MFALIAITALFFSACTSPKNKISPDKLKRLEQNHALVVAYDNRKVLTYDDNGIKPLFKHLAAEGSFKNAYIFDKVTGRASALVLAYGGAERLYTVILSKEAIPVLKKYKIKYSADKVVDFIVNKTGSDKCPMEKSVACTDNPAEAYKILKEKFN